MHTLLQDWSQTSSTTFEQQNSRQAPITDIAISTMPNEIWLYHLPFTWQIPQYGRHTLLSMVTHDHIETFVAAMTGDLPATGRWEMSLQCVMTYYYCITSIFLWFNHILWSIHQRHQEIQQGQDHARWCVW